MNRFDKIKQMNIDEFAKWLDRHTNSDDSDWLKWWDKKYCNNCASEFVYVDEDHRKMECCWCELNDGCKFFPELDEAPDFEEIIKMWLESEEDDN